MPELHQRLAMRDGVRLATDVLLPDGAGPHPVVLLRTPYDRGNLRRDAVAVFLPAGYAVVVQDWRGRFASEGRQVLFLSEADDGEDTCAWVAAQPWCNGRLGTWGSSALGVWQALVAPRRPAGLVCQQIDVAAGRIYPTCWQGGTFREGLVTPYLVLVGYEPQNLNLARDHPRDDAFWAQLDADSRAAEITVPGLFTGGWYDIFCQSTIDTWRARQHRGGPGARGRQKLVMGPWAHGRGATVGEWTFPGAEDLPAPFSGTAWLDRWLRDVPNGIDAAPPVTWYQMGDPEDPDSPGCRWRTADDWPPRHTPTRLYLTSDGGLQPTPPPPTGTARELWSDPLRPVPTLGGAEMNLPSGPRDQRTVESRDDVLSYTGPPLEAPLAVAGRVAARIWVTTTMLDADLSVRLCDVLPDGRSMLLGDGIQRLRCRPDAEFGRPLMPGLAVSVEVDLGSTAYTFGRGHRIRLSLAGGNWPRFDVNPQTGRFWWSERRPVAGGVTIFSEAGRPSHLELPVSDG